jgi:hypothetical protein
VLRDLRGWKLGIIRDQLAQLLVDRSQVIDAVVL